MIGYVVLRNFATWVMIVGVFVALSLRAVGFDHSHEKIRSSCCHSIETCCKGHLDTNVPTDHQHDEKNCPHDHHHHGCCASALLLIADLSFTYRLGVPGSSLLGVRHDGEVPPEGPLLESEKPPLI